MQEDIQENAWQPCDWNCTDDDVSDGNSCVVRVTTPEPTIDPSLCADFEPPDSNLTCQQYTQQNMYVHEDACILFVLVCFVGVALLACCGYMWSCTLCSEIGFADRIVLILFDLHALFQVLGRRSPWLLLLVLPRLPATLP